MIMNYVLCAVLQAYAKKGFKSVMFGNKELKLSSIEMDILCMNPIMVMQHRAMESLDEPEPPLEEESFLFPLSIGEYYRLDMGAGRFWVFDHERPIHLATRDCFIKLIGIQTRDCTKYAKVKLAKMNQNKDHCGRVASLLHYVLLELGMSLKQNGPEIFKGFPIEDQETKLYQARLASNKDFTSKMTDYLVEAGTPLGEGLQDLYVEGVRKRIHNGK